MKKFNMFCLGVAIAFSALADDVSKAPEPDWESICFAISNNCVRFRHPEDTWMAIAATKVKYKLTEDQMLEAFRRCIEGLGDTLSETMACERIVHCMSGDCGTNALPYVEYLIENDRRDSVARCAFRELIKLEPSIDRRILFAEGMLDPKSGRDDCSRVVVYQELCDVWAWAERNGSPSDREKLVSFFERRRLKDERFNYRAPQVFRPPKSDDEVDWFHVCYGISNMFVNAKPPKDVYMWFAGTRNSYNLTKDQLLAAFRRCLEGLGSEGRELIACEQIVLSLGDACGTNAIPCLERLALSDDRESVATCAFRELMKLKPFVDGESRPATLNEFRAAKREVGR